MAKRKNMRKYSSFRCKSSYSELPCGVDIFRTPPMLTPIKDLMPLSENRLGLRSYKSSVSKRVVNFGDTSAMNITDKSTRIRMCQSEIGAISAPSNKRSADNLRNKKNDEEEYQRSFPGMSGMKRALSSIRQKLGRKPLRIPLRDSPYTNAAFTTPRRSERIAKLKTPSPLNMKMYSPFCIETPGLDGSFSASSRRRVHSVQKDIETPGSATPHKVVRRGLAELKQLSKTLSGSHLPSAGGY